MNQVIVQRVREVAAKAAVYRLRYGVYFEEFGDERFADHVAKVYSDSDDVDDSILLAAACEQSGEVVGTIRLKPLSRREFLTGDLFDFDELSKLVSIDREQIRISTVLLDRGVVARSHRRLGVMNSLLCESERCAAELGCEFLLLAVAVANIVAETKFLEFGFAPFRSTGNHCGLLCNHFFKRI